MTASVPLTFAELDGIVFAAARGRLANYVGRAFHLADIGPWLEMGRLQATGSLVDAPAALFASQRATAPLEAALGPQSSYTEGAPIRSSFVVRAQQATHRMEDLARLGIEAQKSANVARIPKPAVLRMTSALGEMFDNIFEHSDAALTGLTAFRSLPGSFEFIVADQGMGVLSSLRRSPRYADLADHGEALGCALQPSVTRYDGADRGHGFDRLVEGMANMNSELRFRSGDALIQMSSFNGGRAKPIVAKRPALPGFIISAKFHAVSPAAPA